MALAQSSSARALTHAAAKAAADGDMALARQRLAEAIEADPGYEPAWSWFAAVCDDPGERLYCLRRAVALRPRRDTRRALAECRKATASVPPELQGLQEPERPPLRTAAPARTSPRKLAVLGGLLLVVVGLASFLVVRHARHPVVEIAVAGGMSAAGVAVKLGQDVARSAQMFADELNAAGGVNGHKVRVVLYDDHDDPQQAKVVAQQIVRSRAVAVVGHRLSSTSAAAGPIYAAAKMPVITATATADSVTADNPWYFRAVPSNSDQGRFIANYLAHVMEVKTLTVIACQDEYGKTLGEAIESTFGGSEGTVHPLVASDGTPAASTSAGQAAAQLAATSPDDSAVAVACDGEAAEKAIVGLRDAKYAGPVVGGDALGSDDFARMLLNNPAEQATPGRYSAQVYAVTPLILDNLSGPALEWLLSYLDRYKQVPGWDAATADSAMALLTYAMRAPGMSLAEQDRAGDRQRIRDVLASADTPAEAVATAINPIYFDGSRSALLPLSMGRIDPEVGLVSAPTQLVAYTPQSGVDIAAELAAGRAVTHGAQTLIRQQIIATGINVNEVSELDTVAGSFFADFFIWFRYDGPDDPADVVFTNAADPELRLDEPLRASKTQGITYRLYRVAARFKATLNFRRFPFDRQQLEIVVQNRRIPAARINYVGDRTVLRQDQLTRLTSGADSTATIDRLPNWTSTKLTFNRQTVGSTAALGDPAILPGESGVYHAQYVASMTIQRDIGPFLVKNLLPLLLLALVTYISLFFPYKDSGTRVSFGVTGILSAAVLLATVTSPLPSVSYTVAIEWGFYAFILLATACVLVALIGVKLYHRQSFGSLRVLSHVALIGYPTFILLVVGAYFLALR